jgi:hypothetical protein
MPDNKLDLAISGGVNPMAFYVFKLNAIKVKFQRGKVPDNDIVTFGVFVNQFDRGHGAGFFPDLTSGALVPAGEGAGAVAPDLRRGMSKDWTIGPLEIDSNDGVSVVYSGMNTSDSPGGLNAQQQGATELKLLDTIVSAVIGASGLGLVGAAVSGALGLIGEPLEKLLGFSKQSPCNGLVFSNGLPFTGGDLEKLPPTAGSFFLHATQAAEFTRSHTDEATHDAGTCGHIAETDVSFTILRLPFVSIKDLALFIWKADTRFPFPGLSLRDVIAFQKLGAPDAAFSLRSNVSALASLSASPSG